MSWEELEELEKPSVFNLLTVPIVTSGVQVIALLALSDEGAPAFDQNHAAAFVSMEIPAFACTPDLFPDLMAAAIQRQNISQWASTNGLSAERAKQSLN